MTDNFQNDVSQMFIRKWVLWRNSKLGKKTFEARENHLLLNSFKCEKEKQEKEHSFKQCTQLDVQVRKLVVRMASGSVN